jgi:hypothetical protein
MAGNVQLGASDPAGAIAASDLIAGAHFQRLKLIHGNDGVNDGDVSRSNPFPTLAIGATTATIANVNEGAAFDPLPAGACRAVYVENNRSGAVDLEFRRGGAGGTRIIPAGAWALIDAITDASQIQMRRADGLAPTVVVSVEYRA